MAGIAEKPASPIFLYAYTFKHGGITYGVEPECVEKIRTVLKTLKVWDRVKEIGAKEKEIEASRETAMPEKDLAMLKKDFAMLEKESSGTFILPGGNAILISGVLGRVGAFPIIAGFVKRGGSFYGSCAGAILGCSKLMQVYPYRESIQIQLLDLLPVQAESPAYPCRERRMQGGDNSRNAQILTETGDQFPAYWNEGPRFSLINTDYPFQFDARYADLPDEPIAAISGLCGKGKVFLIGFHPEFEPLSAEASKTEKKEEKKEEKEDKRTEIFHAKLRTLGI